MDMAGDDWNRCWGEIFEIYRRGGRRDVLSGDTVALHYPRENGKWLSCLNLNCVKGTCPGTPDPDIGFSSTKKWNGCNGEVFRIYARKKIIGTPINSDDDVALLIQKGHKWVSQGYDVSTTKSSCMDKVFPQPDFRFDACEKENFRLWKKYIPLKTFFRSSQS